MRPRFHWLALPLAVFALDGLSKAWVLAHVLPESPRVLIPDVFNLRLGFNEGAIFGSFAGAPAWLRASLFTGATIVALAYFGWEFLREGTAGWERVALGLILGGILGNSLDRLRHGHVVDFFDVVIRGWHYWTFNVADSFIVSGAILYGISLLPGKDKKLATDKQG